MIWTCINGQFFEQDKAGILTTDLALQRGYAAFDFFRTEKGRPLFLNDYLDRFFNSAREMFIDIPFDKETVTGFIFELMKKNQLEQSGVRLLATGGYSPDSYAPVTANLIIQQQPVYLPAPEKREKGIKIMTYEYMRDLPAVKSTNYLMGIWLQKQLQERGLEDVLYYRNNSISEFPRANVFIVTNGKKLVTPAANILQGITRKRILEFAPRLLPVEIRDITVDELKNAAEVFMTSTTKRILSVTEIDGVVIGSGKTGPVTQLLNAAFVSLEKEQSSPMV